MAPTRPQGTPGWPEHPAIEAGATPGRWYSRIAQAICGSTS